LLWTASGIGLVIGSFLVGAILEQRDLLAAYPFAFVPWTAGLVGAAIAPNVWLAALAMVITGVGNGLAFPMTVLIVQRGTTDATRGRAFTLIISAHNALLAVAMIAAGGLVEAVGARWAYLLAAALSAVAALVAVAMRRSAEAHGALVREQAA
jgi:MFS family permease